jgi:hypothetical protein
MLCMNDTSTWRLRTLQRKDTIQGRLYVTYSYRHHQAAMRAALLFSQKGDVL